MTKSWATSASFASRGALAVVVVVTLLIPAAAASASVAALVRGSLTVTVPGTTTPITMTAGQASPAMTYTASGIGLSGFPNSTHFLREIQVRPGGSAYSLWMANGWSTIETCPTGNSNVPGPITMTTTLSDCGITGVYVNGIETTGLQVYAEVTSSQIPNTLVISTLSGDLFSTIDSAGTIRVELQAGTWELAADATTANGWSMRSRSMGGTLQGVADTTTRSVTFDANGGIGYPYSQTKTTNAAASLSTNTFTHETESFLGWNSMPDGTGTQYGDSASYPFAQSETLYAQWGEATDGGSGSGDGGGSGDGDDTTGGGVEDGAETLARTGVDPTAPLALAGLLVLAGVGVLLATRRRLVGARANH